MRERKGGIKDAKMLFLYVVVPERQDDCDPERDLLARVRRQAEHQDRQARHHHAGEHDVVHVVQRLPTYSKKTQ